MRVSLYCNNSKYRIIFYFMTYISMELSFWFICISLYALSLFYSSVRYYVFVKSPSLVTTVGFLTRSYPYHSSLYDNNNTTNDNRVYNSNFFDNVHSSGYSARIYYLDQNDHIYIVAHTITGVRAYNSFFYHL